MERLNYNSDFQKGFKMNCYNYWGISLLLTCYKILLNILLTRLIPYIGEINEVLGEIDRLRIKFLLFGKFKKEMGI